MEDLTGWDVLVVQKELHSKDRRKLWGSPVRVYAAPAKDAEVERIEDEQAQMVRVARAARELQRLQPQGTV